MRKAGKLFSRWFSGSGSWIGRFSVKRKLFALKHAPRDPEDYTRNRVHVITHVVSFGRNTPNWKAKVLRIWVDWLELSGLILTAAAGFVVGISRTYEVVPSIISCLKQRGSIINGPWEIWPYRGAGYHFGGSMRLRLIINTENVCFSYYGTVETWKSLLQPIGCIWMIHAQKWK